MVTKNATFCPLWSQVIEEVAGAWPSFLCSEIQCSHFLASLSPLTHPTLQGFRPFVLGAHPYHATAFYPAVCLPQGGSQSPDLITR